jgi:hypothetical protein
MKFIYSLIKKVDHVSSDSIYSGEIDKSDILKISAPDGSYQLMRADEPNHTITEQFSDEVHEYFESLGPVKYPDMNEVGCDPHSDLAIEYAIHYLITGKNEFEAFSPGQSSELLKIGWEWLRVTSVNNTIRVEKLEL